MSWWWVFYDLRPSCVFTACRQLFLQSRRVVFFLLQIPLSHFGALGSPVWLDSHCIALHLQLLLCFFVQDVLPDVKKQNKQKNTLLLWFVNTVLYITDVKVRLLGLTSLFNHIKSTFRQAFTHYVHSLYLQTLCKSRGL